ncbi:serine/threonine-protein kinase [Streptomyces sp. NPDC016845]|uniref:serine/threonine-protein kinase n=1 Tax=Streptomyces sp. NPDC016845 TaxID=3364972 RepID=UPI00378CB884
MRGRVINGRYRLLETIGSGGMGQVWRARDEDLDRVVALKLFAPPDDVDAAERRELVRRFRREARAVAALSSEHVVTVHDHGTDTATGAPVPYLVMEVIDGESLQEILRREVRLPVERALALARQAALGLAAAHRAGIVHRDIKPANLMVTPAGTLKILDFGIAAFLEGTEAATRLTRTGALPLGSVLYMAPERFRQDPADARTDLYALGCVLYECLVGRPPFTGPAAGVMYNHLHDTPMPVSRIRAEVPTPVDGLIAALLSKSPEDRPGDAAEVTTTLEKPRPPTPTPATPPPSPAPPNPAPQPPPARTPGAEPRLARASASASARAPRRRARRRRLLLGVVSLICVGAGVAVPVAMRDEGQSPPRRPVGAMPPAAAGTPFRIAVTGTTAGHPDTRAVRQALDDYAGSLPLEAVAVPPPEGTAHEYADVIALIGTEPRSPGFPHDAPALRTCRPPATERPTGRTGSPGLVEQFASYLERGLRTRRLLAPDAKALAPLASRFSADRRPGHAYTTYGSPPRAQSGAELRALLDRAAPDTVYLADQSNQQADVTALREAGYRGRVVLAPNDRDGCRPPSDTGLTEDEDKRVYRFRTTSNAPFREGECLQDPAWCDRVRPLMTHPGALEEYEAAQAVIAAFRTAAPDATDPADVRRHLKAALPAARVNGLQGDYTLGSLGDTATRPAWVDRRTDGTWTTLGTVASLTRT